MYKSNINERIFIFICLFLFCSCDHQNVKVKPGYQSLTKQAIQGERFKFRFNLDSTDQIQYGNNRLYAQVNFYPSLDTGSYHNFIILSLSNEFEGDFIVPKNTAAFQIRLSTQDDWVTYYYKSPVEPIWRDVSKIERRAREQLFNNLDYVDAQKGKELFWAEQNEYPDNISIFGSRWLFELQCRQMNRDTIENHLSYLSKYKTHAFYSALCYIGQTILANGKADSLPNYILKNNIVFDNPSLATFILKTFDSRARYTELILKNNPLTRYTEARFNDGSYKNISPSVALSVIDTIIKKRPFLINKYYKAAILWRHFPELLNEINTLLDEVIQASERGNIYSNGLDPWHRYSFRRLDSYLLMADILARRGLYDSALSMVSRGRKTLSIPMDSRHSFALVQSSEYFKCKGAYDSSVFCLAGALFYNPELSPIRDSLRIYYNSLKENLSFEHWLDKLQRSLPPSMFFDFVNKLPPIQIADGSIIDLNERNNSKIILEFWSAGCKFCNENVMVLNEFLSRKTVSDQTRLFLVSDNEAELLTFLDHISANIPYVRNWKKIITAFGVKSYPVTVIIDNGRLIRQVVGSFKSSNIAEIVSTSPVIQNKEH